MAATLEATDAPKAFDRSFDYGQRVLLAVEYGSTPRALSGLPGSYAVFRRISIAELMRGMGAGQLAPGGPPAGGDVERVLSEHMGYWEQRVPAGQQCFVHYAIGTPEAVTGLSDRLAGEPRAWTLLGSYHLEPQSSSYPFGFPTQPVPDTYRLGHAKPYTDDSIFWFNFFPAQPFLFEKTFAVWARFCLSQASERGECNQLVASDGAPQLRTEGVDEIVQVNLNRFTSLRGFLEAARGAGEATFTVDPDYRWYGMLLRKL